MRISIKRGLIWGSVYSIILIGLRYLLNYAVVNYHPYYTNPPGTVDVGRFIVILEKFQFPPPFWRIFISSVIIGFILGMLLNWRPRE